MGVELGGGFQFFIPNFLFFEMTRKKKQAWKTYVNTKDIKDRAVYIELK